MVEHGGGVSYGIETFLANLLFYCVCTSHLNEGAPSVLDEAVAGLATGISGNGLALVGVDPPTTISPN